MSARTFAMVALACVPLGRAEPVAPLEAAQALLASGRFTEASLRADAVLDGEERSPSLEREEHAAWLDLYVEATYRSGRKRTDDLRRRGTRAIELKRSTYGDEHPEVGASLHRYGSLLWQMGEYDSARGVLEEALALRRRILPEAHPDIGRTLHNLGRCHSMSGRQREAIEYLEESLEVLTAALGPVHPVLAIAYTSLTQAQLAGGDYPGAQESNARSIEQARESLGEDSAPFLLALSVRGALRWWLADYPGARADLERACAAYAEPERDLLAELPTCRNNLGGLLFDSGDLPGAERQFESALELWTELSGEQHPNVGLALKNLGIFALRAERPRRARDRLRRSNEILVDGVGERHPEVGRNLSLIGVAERRLGRFDEAIRLQREAVARVEAAEAGDLFLAHVLEELGVTYLEVGRAREALEALERSHSLASRALGAHGPLAMDTTVSMARARNALGDAEAARALALEASRRRAEHLAWMVASVPERQALAYSRSNADALELLLRLTHGRGGAAVERAWDVVIATRALVLDGRLPSF